MAPDKKCADCGQTKFKKVRTTPCPKCHKRYKGYVRKSTAKECTGSDCKGGAKKSDPNKDCNDCQGTGKKLTRCDHPHCKNGNVEYSCRDDSHR
jgi:hypothetical protein